MNIQDVIDCLDKMKVRIDYLDHDSLDDHPEILQSIIRGNTEAVQQTLDDWFFEAKCDSAKFWMENLEGAVIDKLGIEDVVIEFFREHYDEIEGLLFERDTFDLIKELLRNTQNQPFFFDTGHYVYNFAYDDEVKRETNEIADFLKINEVEKIKELLKNSRGGKLCVFFTGDPDKFSDIGKCKTVEFTDPELVIFDAINGSGHDVTLKGVTLTFDFDATNLYVDAAIKYNYTHDICMMNSCWCNRVKAVFK